MHRTRVFHCGLLLGALGVTGAGRAAQPGDACGEPGKPPCPLQHWMRVNAAAPLATGDLQRLAQSFEAIERMNPAPDKWGNWTRFAREGAQAAKEGNASAARSVCGRCHGVYRRGYNAQYRLRKVP